MQRNTVSNQVKIRKLSLCSDRVLHKNRLFWKVSNSALRCACCVWVHTWVKCDLFKDQKCRAGIASVGFWHSDNCCSYALPFSAFKCSEDL